MGLASLNGEKIRKLLDGEEDAATLYRTCVAGPSRQRKDLRVGVIVDSSSYDPTDCYVRLDYDFVVYNGRMDHVGYINYRNNRWECVFEYHNGDLEYLGYGNRASVAVDVMCNGEHAALNSHDSRRISGSKCDWHRSDREGRTE